MMSTINRKEQLIAHEVESVHIIDIENQDVSSLWELICKCVNLEEIYLTGCKLDTLPTKLFKLPKLRTAEFRRNNIITVDFEQMQSSLLRSINFDDNTFEELPEEINQVFWEKLSFAGNKISRLPEKAGKLTGLTVLNLDNNKIRRLPGYFDENVLCYLQYLYLSHNQLTDFPSKIGRDDMNFLKAIHLHSNEIKELPAHIEGTKNVRSLIVSSNKLDQFPECIRQMPALETLYLAHNQIKFVPDWLGIVENLIDLDLGGNPLDDSDIIAITQVRSLEYLRLYECGLTKLAEEIGLCTNLIELDLTGNGLTSLPTSIGQLRQLETLKIGWNQLIDLPEELFELKNLKNIDLNGNESLNLVTKQKLLKHFNDGVYFG